MPNIDFVKQSSLKCFKFFLKGSQRIFHNLGRTTLNIQFQYQQCLFSKNHTDFSACLFNYQSKTLNILSIFGVEHLILTLTEPAEHQASCGPATTEHSGATRESLTGRRGVFFFTVYFRLNRHLQFFLQFIGTGHLFKQERKDRPAGEVWNHSLSAKLLGLFLFVKPTELIYMEYHLLSQD